MFCKIAREGPAVSVHVFPVSYVSNSTTLNIPFNQIHTCISHQWASSSNLRCLLLLINQRQKARLFLTGCPRGRRTRPPPSFPTKPSTSSYLPASRQLSLLLCNGWGKRNQRSLTDRAVDTILLIGATLFWPVDVRCSLQSHIWWFLIILRSWFSRQGFMMEKSDKKQQPACQNLAMCMNWGG